MNENREYIDKVLEKTFSSYEEVLESYRVKPWVRELGFIQTITHGVAIVSGLLSVKSEELIRFENGIEGLALDLRPDQLGVILLERSRTLRAGMTAKPTGRVLDVPVGDAMVGRIVNPLGQAIDNQGPMPVSESRAIEQSAPQMMDRLPVQEPLQTGIKSIDALIPIGRGQRELILGDRQTGKSAVALDTIINQRDKNVLCVYCAIGQRESSVAKFVADLKKHDAMQYSIVVVASGENTPGMQFIAPYAATAIAEYFMGQGRDVLIVYDDLTRHARAYREISLLLRRPPGREAYPGDIFYIHSRLLERATNLKEEYGGGSLTALPIIETQAQNISAYIPTNLISITDGQIYLSPELFQRGLLPAVDVGRSVSRVGGKAQLPAYRLVSSDLRLSYSQYEELEAFARFGTRLDESTQKRLERGRRVREILKQEQFEPIPVPEQIAVMMAVNEGFLDDIPLDQIRDIEKEIRRLVHQELSQVNERIREGKTLSDTDKEQIREGIQKAINIYVESRRHGNA